MKPLSEEYRANTIPGYYDIDRMLHVAVQVGDVAQVRTLLECGADVHSVFLPARMQVLTKAVLMHHVEMVKLILEYEDREKRDHYWGKNTPVRLAKREGLTELIPLLTLEDDDEDDDEDEYDSQDDELSEAEQAVVQGVEDGCIEEVRKGLAAGVSIENIYGYVIWYIMDRETPELLDLFAPEKWNQWMLNRGLYWACNRSNAAALHRLLDLGADAHSHGGTQAYFCATLYADLDCMKVMLERGKVDPLQPNDEDSHATAMDELIGTRDAADSVEPYVYEMSDSKDDARDIIRLLQEYGCIEGELVEHGTLAAPCPHLRLLIAAQRGDVAAVRQALADGADVNARGWAGATALMKAARLGHIEMAQLLLDHGADAQVDMYCRKEARDVNVHHRLRVTALYQAARSGSMEMVQLMLPLITTPELRAREVSQALFPAAARGLNDMIQLFLREGADINIHYTSDFEGIDETEWTPLEYALRNKLDDTIALLLAVRRGLDDSAHHEPDSSSTVPANKYREEKSYAWRESRERLRERACQYRDGKGVEKNLDEAMRLLNLAADMGDDFALFLLGKYHADGRYVPKDLEKSYQFYKQSAAQGYLRAQVDLGRAYELGEGTAVDEAKALFWYRKASDGGCPVATNNLAHQLLWGKGVRHNRAEGFRLYSHVAADVKNKLCPLDHNYLRVSWYGLGKCYEQGAGVPRDREAALRWYRKSADAGYDDAMYRLGRFYERGIVVEKDEAEAAGWYLRAAKRGCTEAHYRIGLCYLRGRGVEKDTSLALRHIRSAAADNHKDALYRLGCCYLRGIGVRRNRKRALTYLRRAADEGNKRAMKFLHAPEGAEGTPVHPEERQ